MNDLRRVCYNILDFCLGIRKGEKVLIFFDRTNSDLALNLEVQVHRFKAVPQLYELPFGEKMEIFPQSAITAAEGLSEEDVLIVLSSANLIHNLNIHKILSPFSRFKSIRSRSLYIPPFPIESLIRIMSIDPNEYEDYQDKLLKALNGVGKIKLYTEAGTNILLQVRKFGGKNTYRAIFASEHAIFHLGEIWTAIVEDSTEGVLVYDTCLSMGKIQSKLILDVSRGRVTEETVVGETDPVINEFLKTLSRADENARIPSELGIGLNPNAQISGCIMEDESVRGTCHIDLGDNISFGGSNRSNFHGGGVMMCPTIEADGKPIIVKGVFKHYRYMC